MTNYSIVIDYSS
jgi:hypothetical protein